MTCDILAFIVHKMIPTTQPRLTARYGNAVLNVNDSIQRLMDELNKRYVAQGGRTFGQFSTDQNNFPISRYLTDSNIFNDSEQFYDLSRNIVTHLVAKASATAATGGWVVMCLYQHNHEKILAVAVVNEVTGASINESFQVEPSVYIDLSKLRHAGRINLTKWQNGADNYVNFIKAVHESTYFKEFLGCDTTNSNVNETNKVIVAINAYCDANNLTYEARQEIKDRAHTFLKSAAKARTPIYLAHLANHLAPEDAETLTTHLASDEYQINDNFIPDGRTLIKLVQLAIKNSFWNIKINREAFQHGAEYDVQSNTLKIPVTNPEEQALFQKEVEGLGDDEQP